MTDEENFFLQEATSNAFPMRNPDPNRDDEFGLNKREYFAAMALQGFVAATRYNSDSDIEYFAQIAVQAADALITELNKVQAADSLIREVNKQPNNDTPNN